MKAVIMAAGYGIRFLPFTKAVSKTMLPIIDKPTIQLIVEEALESGIDEILIIVGANKDAIIKHFSYDENLTKKIQNNKEFLEILNKTNLPNIKFVEQKVLNGTGGAIMLAKDFVRNDPFVLMFADDLFVGNNKPVAKQLIEVFNKTGKSIMGCMNVSKEAITKYCSVEYSSKENRVYTVTKITEKPKLEDVKSTLSCLGRYVLKPNIFDACEKLTEKNGEKIITDAYDLLSREGDVLAYDIDGVRYDIGNKLGYLTALFDFALKDEKYSNEIKSYLKTKI